MIPQDQITPPSLSYRYRFRPDEAEAVRACVADHGFAVVEALVSPDHVERLRHAVRTTIDPDGTLQPGEARTHHAFLEDAPVLLDLVADEHCHRLNRVLAESDHLRFGRSAAIIRMPGAPALPWHSDWSFWSGLYRRPPRRIDDLLNVHEGIAGAWLYLEGTHPLRAGLAVIADSHRLDWSGPAGFAFTEDRTSFYPEGSEPHHYAGWDVPGIVPLFTAPGDLIVFAARTYHYAFPHRGSAARHSCSALPLVAADRLPALPEWPLSPRTRRFLDGLPQRFRPFAEGYRGYDPTWRPQPQASSR